MVVTSITGGKAEKEPKDKKDHWYKHGESWFWILVVLGIATWFGIAQYNHHKDVQAAKLSCSNPHIKGNISFTTGEKIYHLPGDPYYDKTIIDTSQGEKMFCTTQEAKNAGFRASGN